MTLVLGIDSSTQSTKALLVDADDGTVVEQRAVPHPPGTAVDPRAWLAAVDEATAGLLPRAEAVGVGGQQHGMVALDAAGVPVHDALLWNDTRSASQAEALVQELGGPQACVDVLGSVLVASFTITKLRWLRDAHPEVAARVDRVLLPHDYVSAHLACGAEFTDRGDASGTGYFSTADDRWRPDLVELALGRPAGLPRVVAPGGIGGRTPAGQVVSAGTGDNMAAALALELGPGDIALSIGTSGVASAVSDRRPADPSGTVTGFADATGRFLPMATTLNAARVLDLQATLLGVSHDELAELALASGPGANGVTISPYYGGERTPNRPRATGTWSGLRPETTRADLARASIEALLCSLADAVDAVAPYAGDSGRIVLIGGGARNRAVRELAPAVLGRDVTVAADGEYVALGAARQAAWALSGAAEPPIWDLPGTTSFCAEPTPLVRESYAQLRDRTASWTR